MNLCFDAVDPQRLERFWTEVLGRESLPFGLAFRPVAEPKSAKNPIHLELVSESVEHQRELVARLLSLGAAPVDIGQEPSDRHDVLADPEGNELCVGVRGEFLADTGFLGAVTFEPALVATGYFWGSAIGWPVVYDEGGDTAIRAPDGRGPFLTFGPPGTAPSGRLWFEIEGDADELCALGARRVDETTLADPNGNEFRLV